MKHAVLLLGLSVVAVLVCTTTANAEEKQNVWTAKPTTVIGNPQRPSAVIELNKARMQLGPTTPTLAAVTKIQDAAKKDPF